MCPFLKSLAELRLSLEVGKGKKKSVKQGSAMSSNKQGVKKPVQRSQTHKRAGKNKSTVKDKHVKNAVEEYRKKQKKSQLSTNLHYFLGSGYTTQNSYTNKILHQNAGRQSRNQPDKPVQKQSVQEKSIFTEEEFQKFQKEYFSSL
ncbi:ribosomal protein S19 binding protein 1 isoform X2 [Trichomycterus rosablanca]|uniref:ribosomal protein S19 binding protein 1 isoform X2 n=1 Tax=Trichomycterus rosablanca TaxID=2290929 RepID=UPI002F350332